MLFNTFKKKKIYEKKILNSCYNGLHHFPLILAFLKVPQTFMPSRNGLNTPILNDLLNLSILNLLINELIVTNHDYDESLYRLFTYCYIKG